MAHVDVLKDATHTDLKVLASKHSSFEDFMHDLEGLAERMWHNARSQGHDPYSIVGDADKTVSELEQDVTDAEQALADARTRLENAKDEQDALVPGPTGEPAPAAQMEPGPTDEGQPITTPAEPASPSSEGGFPTTNVGVVVNDNPDDGTAVPVGEHPAEPAKQ